MATMLHLYCLLLLAIFADNTYAKVVHLPVGDKLLFVGSNFMDLPATQKLCHSLGGELPTLRNYYEDMEQIRKLTYEPVWLGVSRNPKYPSQSHRKYFWSDGSTFSDLVIEEIAPVACKSPCCTLRLRPDPSNTRVTEVACNTTMTLPLCVTSLNSDSMAKILAADNVFTTSEDRLGLAMYVLPKFTKQLYDRVEGHRKTTHPILYVLMVVCLSFLMVIAVMGIIAMRGNQGARRKKNTTQLKSAISSSSSPGRKVNGQQQALHQQMQGRIRDRHEEETLMTSSGTTPDEFTTAQTSEV